MVQRILKFCGMLACAVLLAGCASGSALVTGTKRDPINPEGVKVYLEAPTQYETIGLIEAESDAGWTKQDSLDYATEELKKQAAKLGANGVLLQYKGMKNTGAVVVPAGSIGVAVPTSSEVISGLAIYVP